MSLQNLTQQCLVVPEEYLAFLKVIERSERILSRTFLRTTLYRLYTCWTVKPNLQVGLKLHGPSKSMATIRWSRVGVTDNHTPSVHRIAEPLPWFRLPPTLLIFDSRKGGVNKMIQRIALSDWLFTCNAILVRIKVLDRSDLPIDVTTFTGYI